MLVSRRTMMVRRNISAVQKMTCVFGLVMIMAAISLLNNVGMQQQQNHLDHYNTNNGNNNHNAAETELLEALYSVPLPTTQQELDELNEELAGLEPKFILRWAHHALLGNNNIIDHQRLSIMNGRNPQHPLVQVTSFGPTGLVILDHLSKYNLLETIPVITMDTLHLFTESYTFYDTIQSYYKESSIDLTITKPVHIAHPPELHGDAVFKGYLSTREEFQEVYSSSLWKTDPRYYTKVTKVDPMEQKLDEWGTIMWMTGRRRSQGGERKELDVLEFEIFPPDEANQRIGKDSDNSNPFDASKGRWKLNPLAYWSYDQVWSYIRNNNVPYNPLYDQGYTSIGDEMTTTLPKERSHNNIRGSSVSSFDERSGRFVGLNQTECGLHTHLQKVKALKKQKEDSGEELEVPELTCEHCIELNVENFLNIVVKNEQNDGNNNNFLLLEFYSPFCGSCQEFAPTLDRVANHVATTLENVKVARFDITEQPIPKVHSEEVFRVEATPTLYLVGYSPSFHAEKYDGNHQYDELIRWLAEKSSNGR
ncbi:hypothetical protein ACHAWC_007668 [Mediolabrus comicus]